MEDPLLSRNGYEYYRQDHSNGKRGGGLVIYIREPLFPFVTPLLLCHSSDHTSEELWILVDKPGRKQPRHCANTYPDGKCKPFKEKM